MIRLKYGVYLGIIKNRNRSRSSGPKLNLAGESRHSSSPSAEFLRALGFLIRSFIHLSLVSLLACHLSLPYIHRIIVPHPSLARWHTPILAVFLSPQSDVRSDKSSHFS